MTSFGFLLIFSDPLINIKLYVMNGERKKL